MKKSLTLFLFLILLFACNKQPDSFTSFSGTVVEQGTNKPVPNAEVNMYWLQRYTFNIIENKIATDSTDANGKFVVEAEAPEGKDVIVRAFADQYYSPTEYKPNIERGEEKQGLISIIPYAWIKLNIFNSEGNDGMQTSRFAGGQVVFASQDTSIIVLTGGQTVSFSVFIDKAGVQQRIDRYSVTTIGHDTVDVRIDF